MDNLIKLFDEGDRLQVFMTPELIGDPLARLPRVVQVEHGGDGVHAKAVDMVLVQPEHGAGEQKSADFIAPEIVNQGAPVLMFALARILMLVKARAVKERESVAILREMPAGPIEDNAEAGLVSLVHEIAEVVRGAETRGWRKVSDGLIAPRPVKGVFGDGQQLDMGVAHLPDIGHQLVGQLTIAEPAHADGIVKVKGLRRRVA